MNVPASPHWLQTASGRAVDLMSPSPDTVDVLGDMAEHLARLARFVGAVPAGPYSVAQHLCLGADAILAETGDTDLAGAFLLHDGHEYVIGDTAPPVAQAIAERVGMELAALSPLAAAQWQRVGKACALRAIEGLKLDMDRAIYAAVGLPFPLPPATRAAVKAWDLRMLAAERLHLLVRPPRRWDPIVEAAQPARLKGRITVWPWPRAADEWRRRVKILFPHLTAQTAA